MNCNSELERSGFNDLNLSDLYRSGMASLDDLGSSDYKELFLLLEKHQQVFLSQQKLFRSPNYKWSLDPLHWWSRIWEYPYVLANLLKLSALADNTSTLKIMDFGSGVTFFPFLLDQLGFDITCVDNDKVCVTDLERARGIIKSSPGRGPSVTLSNDESIPLASNTFDAIFSISVIEHIVNIERTVQELTRLLKPNGHLILTIDLCARGSADIGPDRYLHFLSLLRNSFNFKYPQVTIHPTRLLSSTNSPYPLSQALSIRDIIYFLKLTTKDLLNSRKPKQYFSQTVLTVEGMFLRKVL